MLARFLTVLACALAVLVPQLAAPAQAQAAPQSAATQSSGTGASGVIVVGASGLSLEDLSPTATPHLWEMAEGGALANLTVRTLTPATCAASGWLSLGAGARMRGADLTPAWQHPLFLNRACPRMVDPQQSDDAVDRERTRDSAEAVVGPQPTGLSPHVLPEYHRIETANADGGYSARAGAFSRPAESASDSGDGTPEGAQPWCTASIGTGAGYAGADAEGQIDLWAPLNAFLGTHQQAPAEAAERRAAMLSVCALTLVDAGTAADPMWDPAASTLWAQDTLGALRSQQIRELDARVGAVLEAAPAGADVIVAGVGDSTYPSRLRALIASGPSYPAGTLTSSSTRQPNLAQLTDVLPAALRSAGLEPAGTSPSTFTVENSGEETEPLEDRVESLRASADEAATIHRHAQTFSIAVNVAFYLLFLVTAIVFAVPVAAALRRRSARSQHGRGQHGRSQGARGRAARGWGAFGRSPRRRGSPGQRTHGDSTPRAQRTADAGPADRTPPPLTRARTVLAWACFTLGLVPAAGFFAGFLPWGRAASPALALALSIAAATAALLLLAVAGPWRRSWAGRIAAVSLVSAVILLADVALGSRLQFNSLMGYNPIVAGRFYGLGNQGAALFLVAALLGLGIVSTRLSAVGRDGWARALTAVFAVGSVFVLSNPAWGAKFGGTVAALVGFAVLLLALFRVRVNLLKLTLIGLGALAVIMGVAGLDYLRPPAERSHFGAFFAQALDGQLLEVIVRKLSANLRIIVINPGLAIVVPLAVFTVLFALAYLRRYRRTTALARPWTGRLPEALADFHTHAGFVSAVLALAVGMVITDSGVAVPATGAMMLVPFLVVMSLDAAQRQETAARRPADGESPGAQPAATAEAGDPEPPAAAEAGGAEPGSVPSSTGSSS